MQTQAESTLIAVRNEKGQLVGVMERLQKGYEIYTTKEANTKEVEMLFTMKKTSDLFEPIVNDKQGGAGGSGWSFDSKHLDKMSVSGGTGHRTKEKDGTYKDHLFIKLDTEE